MQSGQTFIDDAIEKEAALGKENVEGDGGEEESDGDDDEFYEGDKIIKDYTAPRTSDIKQPASRQCPKMRFLHVPEEVINKSRCELDQKIKKLEEDVKKLEREIEVGFLNLKRQRWILFAMMIGGIRVLTSAKKH